MQAPNIDYHLKATQYNADYLIPKDKSLEYKLDMVSQFVNICIENKETVGFPNSTNYHLPFIIMVKNKGLTTQLVIPVDNQKQMDSLQERANSLLREAGK